MTTATQELHKKHPTLELALKAVDTILDNLAQSDFAADYGTKGLAALADFRLDMAVDIAKIYEAK